jgi:prepilin-type N-terminal cleavage/methylation domain-containing protein
MPDRLTLDHAAQPRSPAGRAGFTILELLLVLVILSLCAATTVRCYFSSSEVTLENAAILLARDLRAAQHRSIFLGEPGRFLFLPDGSGYALTDAGGTITHHPQTDEPFVRVYPEDGVFIGVIVSAARAGDDRTLDIDARGMPLEELEVTLAFEGAERTVVLDPDTNDITIEGSTSGWTDVDG